MSATPTIYFIDDSATMREVIKIAFRRENINVVACHDAALALVEIEKTRPDIVITDVIMPDKDGYDVCQYIKSHPELARTPVVLMSGVVNRAVAEKAFAVKADELLRKPFQPQDLIARVKHLLKPNGAPKPTLAAAATALPGNRHGSGRGGRLRRFHARRVPDQSLRAWRTVITAPGQGRARSRISDRVDLARAAGHFPVRWSAPLRPPAARAAGAWRCRGVGWSRATAISRCYSARGWTTPAAGGIQGQSVAAPGALGPYQTHAGSRPACHLILQPMLGICSCVTGLPPSSASQAARRSG